MRIVLIPISIAFSNQKILCFLFLGKLLNLGSEMRKIKLQKIVGEFIRQGSKAVDEWKGHLEASRNS